MRFGWDWRHEAGGAVGLLFEILFDEAARRIAATVAGTVGRPGEALAQADLVRCLFSNPFRKPAVDPAVLAWNDGAAVRLAEAIYQERAFDRLAVLGDLLEEAGCADAVILAHCRGPGPHARGCFVVDALTGWDRGRRSQGENTSLDGRRSPGGALGLYDRASCKRSSPAARGVTPRPSSAPSRARRPAT
jgi:hypothetical protein